MDSRIFGRISGPQMAGWEPFVGGSRDPLNFDDRVKDLLREAVSFFCVRLYYARAEQHKPSGEQVCRVLAQLARALEAVHAAGAVHRDVKGDNVLVRVSGAP